jgi:hypothetical protein
VNDYAVEIGYSGVVKVWHVLLLASLLWWLLPTRALRYICVTLLLVLVH